MAEFEVPSQILDICKTLQQSGGRGLLVGGCVRDYLLGTRPKDFDIEVYNLSQDLLVSLLKKFGEVISVGQSFGVYKLKHTEIDISLPRKDSKVSPGHRGFDIQVDEGLDFKEASKRRDLTINSIGYDPLTGELLDPHEGQKHLKQKRLFATDAHHFAEDPLRALRVMQFAARFEMEADDSLIELCSQLDLSELAGERVLGEFEKLLLKGNKPSIGLEFLKKADLLKYFPELEVLVGVPQSKKYHPEGDVWTHTLMCLDEAAKLRPSCPPEDHLTFMLAVLCHDLGKPFTTGKTNEGDVHHRGHEEEGVAHTLSFLERMRASNETKEKVSTLVRHHLAPLLLTTQEASNKAYLRLARKLGAAKVKLSLLALVARADLLGRTTKDALESKAPLVDEFEEKVKTLDVFETPPPAYVEGKHLLNRGIEPGPKFGKILEECLHFQDESGETDPEKILDHVLKKL